MYNYHKYLQDRNLSEKQLNKFKQIIKETILKKQYKQKLAQNYYKRVENFMREVSNKPQVNTNKPKQQSIKNLKEKFFINGFKTERDRIKAQFQNRYIDTTPMKSISSHQFRSRQLQKQIQSEMKFKPHTSLERIDQYFSNTITLYVQNKKAQTNNKSSKQFYSQSSYIQKKSNLLKQISKNLLPQLHQKSHFKGVQEIYNRLPFSNTLNLKKKQKNQTDLDSFRNMIDPLSHFDPLGQIDQNEQTSALKKNKQSGKKNNRNQISKKILINYHLIKQRNQNIKVLHKGKGKNTQ